MGYYCFLVFMNLFFCLDTKETKNQASIFLHQKSSDKFPYRNPSRSCFTLDSGSLRSANAEILTVIFSVKL